MAGARFRILGPLEVWAGDTRLSLRGPRQERCLAAMLLEPGQMVSFAALVDATWDDPPSTARRQVQDLVGGLRRLLDSQCGGPGGITAHRAGYLLEVDAAGLDSLQFEELATGGRRVASTDPRGAAGMLRSALELCRGATLAGIGSRALEPAVARWEERRLTVREDWLALELGLGHHSLMVGELTELAAAHPLRERPAGLDDTEAISQAAQAVGVHHDLCGLPRGYDTLLSRVFPPDDGESGAVAQLSGGQWQRIAVARAILREVDLYILDEPTSGLDAQAEALMHERLRERHRDRTGLLISHRLSSLREADQIVVLAQGRVAERGPHTELMAADGAYAGLFRLQGKGYRDDHSRTTTSATTSRRGNVPK